MTTAPEYLQVLSVLMPLLLAIVVGYFGRQAQADAKAAKQATENVAVALDSTTATTTAKLDTIHVLVNSRLTEALAKIDRLETKLYNATGEKPSGEPPPAIPPPG